MIETCTDLFYIHDEEIPLFLPSPEIVATKNWVVCALREDCGCLDTFDDRGYIQKAVDFHQKSYYFELSLFGFSLDTKETIRINHTKEIFQKIDSLINEMNTGVEYYESFALTDNECNFLILHTHGDDTTFICGEECFVKYQLDTDNIELFMHGYYDCIRKHANFCRPFPWSLLDINDKRYY